MPPTCSACRATKRMLLQDINSEQNRWTEFNQRLEELERSLPRR